MKLTKLFLANVFVLALAFSSCDKENNNIIPNPEPTPPANATEKILVLDTRDRGSWTYIDFKTGKTQKYAIQENNATTGVTIDWQLGLHSYTNVKTNGLSGLNTGKSKFEEVTSAPKDGYVADVDGRVLKRVGAMPPPDEDYQYTKINMALKPFEGDPMSNGRINDKVLILKCKDGKFVKLQFLDNSNDEGVKGFMKIKYVYPFK